MADLIKNVEHEAAFAVAELVACEPGRVNSITLAQEAGAKITVFAIPAGEGIGGHSAPGDAMPFVLQGAAEITINGEAHTVEAGHAIVIPAGAPHAVKALSDMKMLLTVVLPPR